MPQLKETSHKVDLYFYLFDCFKQIIFAELVF